MERREAKRERQEMEDIVSELKKINKRRNRGDQMRETSGWRGEMVDANQ